jgi:hypothetical protein
MCDVIGAKETFAWILFEDDPAILWRPGTTCQPTQIVGRALCLPGVGPERALQASPRGQRQF